MFEKLLDDEQYNYTLMALNKLNQLHSNICQYEFFWSHDNIILNAKVIRSKAMKSVCQGQWESVMQYIAELTEIEKRLQTIFDVLEISL
jgi:hypothetical protein